MSSPWLQSMTPVAPPTSANPGLRFMVYAGIVTGAWSGVVCLAIYGIGRLAGVPFLVVTRSGDPQAQVTWLAPLLVPIAFGVLGALAASLLLGRRRARLITLWVGTLLALGSAVGPFTQPGDVLWSTRIWLVVMHVVTWFLVVPQLARIVGDSEPGASVDRGD
ncbi:unannotated protein [freshwater metagenome]|jgi:hypothetical protein|uniref:Unannotated protein n=1 Tax=freshwater metagenome TaxID=449393 RepID=A0A6J7IV31_9ZZZZ